MAKVAMAAPTSPTAAPVRKPLRRPTRFMNIDAGKAASAAPITYDVAGSVESVLSTASAKPASAPIEISVTALVSSSAWQQARRKTLRRSASPEPVEGPIESERLAFEAQCLLARRAVLRDRELHHERVLAGALDQHVAELPFVGPKARELRLQRAILLLPSDPARVEVLDDEAQAPLVFLESADLVVAGIAVGSHVAEGADHDAGLRRAHERLDRAAVAFARPVDLHPRHCGDLRRREHFLRRFLRHFLRRLLRRFLRLRPRLARDAERDGDDDHREKTHIPLHSRRWKFDAVILRDSPATLCPIP